MSFEQRHMVIRTSTANELVLHHKSEEWLYTTTSILWLSMWSS